MQGQISIFDYMSNNDDFETMPIERAIEILQDRTPLRFKLDERFFQRHYSATYKGIKFHVGFKYFAPGVFNGSRFLDCSADYGTAGRGNPTQSMEEAVRFCNKSIEDYIKE